MAFPRVNLLAVQDIPEMSKWGKWLYKRKIKILKGNQCALKKFSLVLKMLWCDVSIWSRDLAILSQLMKVKVSKITHDNGYTQVR